MPLERESPPALSRVGCWSFFLFAVASKGALARAVSLGTERRPTPPKTKQNQTKNNQGFLVNRVLLPSINEAFYCLMEGVGTAQDIDQAMRLGCAQPLGPLALADHIGLETVLSILEVMQHGMGDPKYRPCPLLRNYVDAGWLGRKTGRGVYTCQSASAFFFFRFARARVCASHDLSHPLHTTHTKPTDDSEHRADAQL
jgi:3-hydroxyacyl-CoA dehydrogenase